MNDSILMAIESLCDDIATNPNANDNHKRAESTALLSASSVLIPNIGYETNVDLDGEAAKPINAPAIGQRFTYKNIDFISLGIVQGGLLAIQAEPLKDRIAFDEENKNDWRVSSLRKFLNEEYIKNFEKDDLLPIVSDLTADDGTDDYGTAEDYIALFTDDIYRKNRKYIPKYDIPVWTITPYSCTPGIASYERFVYTAGSLHSSNAYYSLGVAPACIFNLKIFE